MPWGGARPGAGRKANPNRPKLKADTKVKAKPTVDATPHQAPAYSMAAVEAVIRASAEAAGARNRAPEFNPFQFPKFPAKAMPPEANRMAMDENFTWASGEWAQAVLQGVTAEGLLFLGYPYLSELAQRPEYRVISETIADDATRKWIDFEVTGDAGENKRRVAKDPAGEAERMADPDERKKRVAASGKTDLVKELKDDQARLEVRDKFYQVARNDGFFGRSHLFMDLGTDLEGDPAELKTPIGDGRDETSTGKIDTGKFKALRVIEPVWCYPTTYNAQNPLLADWYNPQVWYVMGREVHATRIPMFVGHPVPDLLKPAYSFGGLSLSQMAKPYVDIWLQTRESVAALIHSFSVMVLCTDLQTLLQPGNATQLLARVAMFNAMRDNQGTFVINKNTEDFKNVSASLAGLHELQSQAQEHVASVVRIPLVKYTGMQPAGLNACLPGETLILTDRGQVPIRDVTLSDRVMTRRGLAPLTFSGITKYATELIEIKTASTVLRCTENHPIWLPSTNAFVRAENVQRGDRLLSIGEKNATQKMRHPYRGADNGGGRTSTGILSLGTLSPNKRSISIAKYGRRIADLFQKDFTFTTAIAIRKTIRLQTLKRCLENFTLLTTASSLAWVVGNPSDSNLCFARNADESLSSRSSRAERSFVAMPARLRTGEQTEYLEQEWARRSAFVQCAARLSAHLARVLSFVRANAQRRAKIAPNTTAPTISRILKNTSELSSKRPTVESDDSGGIVLCVRRIWASEPVYDLTVAPGYPPEFFANEILTHNSSEGEIDVYDDTISAYQNRFFRPKLTRVVNFEQLSLWGKIDPEISIVFEPLRQLTEKERGEKQKAEAERDQIYVDMGALSPAEVRKRVVDDPELPYAGLNPVDLPDLEKEEEAGLEPEGGRPDPKSDDAAKSGAQEE